MNERSVRIGDNLVGTGHRVYVVAELGINHTYLFFEGNFAWITGFNNPSKIVLSDITWNAGLAFEF